MRRRRNLSDREVRIRAHDYAARLLRQAVAMGGQGGPDDETEADIAAICRHLDHLADTHRAHASRMIERRQA